jgi:N-methylhydantoinase B
VPTRRDPVRLRVFHELFAALCEECGELLRGTAPSVNIRERLDFSCALFDPDAALVAQAAHIPVHLGSAGLSARVVRETFADLAPGDAVLLNDPYAGGTHLPDLTLVTPVFPERARGRGDSRPWFVVNRAHHSDVGGSEPGSMAPARDVLGEGLRIPPTRLVRAGQLDEGVLALLLANTRSPGERRGDLLAQVEANAYGARRLRELWERYGVADVQGAAEELANYSERIVRAALAELEPGCYRAEERIEGDGVQLEDIVLRVELEVASGKSRSAGHVLHFDFSETDPQGPGSLNANPAIVSAALLYCVRCLVEDDLPTNAGLHRCLDFELRPGSLLDPEFPAAVAGGNVETSQRLVDLAFRVLGMAGADVPAQSAGTMNNLSFGGRYPAGHEAAGESFAFYETLGGGAGASRHADAASGVQTHMTNTRNTSVEELEHLLPVTVTRYSLRRRSGGAGEHRGGDGLVKELRAEVPLRVSLLCDRRRHAPAGLDGGGDGKCGRQFVVRGPGRLRAVPAKGKLELHAGDRLRLETPGGGGCGTSEA